MASSSLHLLLAALTAAFLFSTAASQTCKSHTFPGQNATTFANCEDLPTLKASIHWTYDASARPDPTLTIAFVAPPPNPDGWIAWALNPTGTGMAGSQALIAFRDANGSVIVNTYNISSYGSIVESRIFYNVLSKRAESSNGTMRIFATLAVPNARSTLNQVWQVGPSVSGGIPARHEFAPANLHSTGTLALGSTTVGHRGSNAPSPAPAPAPAIGTGGGGGGAAAAPRTQSGNDTGGSWRVGGNGSMVYGVLVLLGLLLGF